MSKCARTAAAVLHRARELPAIVKPKKVSQPKKRPRTKLNPPVQLLSEEQVRRIIDPKDLDGTFRMSLWKALRSTSMQR